MSVKYFLKVGYFPDFGPSPGGGRKWGEAGGGGLQPGPEGRGVSQKNENDLP